MGGTRAESSFVKRTQKALTAGDPLQCFEDVHGGGEDDGDDEGDEDGFGPCISIEDDICWSFRYDLDIEALTTRNIRYVFYLDYNRLSCNNFYLLFLHNFFSQYCFFLSYCDCVLVFLRHRRKG